MNRILSIVTTAYRATQEEQDDAVLWVNRALVNGGAQIDFLLQGSAVNYAVARQDPAGLVIGSVAIERPAVPPADLLAAQDSGMQVFVDRDDVEALGIEPGSLERQFELIPKTSATALFEHYDQVWLW
ncbi:MAG: hypothetical protein AAFN78_05575 [Pseudomonadota bacterium]